MDTSIRYAAFVIFLIIVVAVVWVLRDGFPIGRGKNSGPIVEGSATKSLRQPPDSEVSLAAKGLILDTTQCALDAGQG